MSDNTPVEIPPRDLHLSNAWYNRLKWVAQIFLPAFGALYFGLSDLWGLPKAYEVVGTITVVDTFLGVLLGLSARNYNNSDNRFAGQLVVNDPADQESRTRMVFTKDLDDLVGKDKIEFKVVRPGNDG
jgi:hypothetical protein